MSFSLAPLLIHDESVPRGARVALRAAAVKSVEPETRRRMLRIAAKILHTEAGLECRDVHELVGTVAEPCI